MNPTRDEEKRHFLSCAAVTFIAGLNVCVLGIQLDERSLGLLALPLFALALMAIVRLVLLAKDERETIPLYLWDSRPLRRKVHLVVAVLLAAFAVILVLAALEDVPSPAQCFFAAGVSVVLAGVLVQGVVQSRI